MSVEDAAELFRRMDREVWLVTASAGGRRGGLIATFVSQASLPPASPRVLVGLACQHHTRGLVEEGRGFALHLLSEAHLDWVWRFGLHSGRDIDKLDGLAARPGSSGAPLLTDALGWLDCLVEATLETGDRTVYLGEVIDARAPGAAPILTVRRLLELAPADLRLELRAQIEHDSAVDARAIAAWRASPRSSGRAAGGPRNG